MIGDEEVVTCRPADLLAPEMDKARAEAGARARSEEDVLAYALFPQVAAEFFATRTAGPELPAETVALIAAALAGRSAPTGAGRARARAR